MVSKRIPLFPLDVVLFPDTPLPLHIFEPRYKLMIQRCLENHCEFGILLARSDEIAPVGCTAQIVKVVKQYPDGRMDILTVGQNAFRVVDLINEQPYLEGEVEYLEDEGGSVAPETQQELLKLYGQCHSLIYGRAPQLPEVDVECSVTFQIAAQLPLEVESKQKLLEIRAEPERQSHLLKRLSEWLPQLARLERSRAKAGGNGHGLR
jgi:Lon protease-like protein